MSEDLTTYSPKPYTLEYALNATLTSVSKPALLRVPYYDFRIQVKKGKVLSGPVPKP